MEWNGTRSNCPITRISTPDMQWKIGVNMPGPSMYGELISCPVPATNKGQAPSRQLRATPSVWNILAIYLESLSGMADPSLTSEGSAMSLSSFGSAMGSRVSSSVSHPGTARQWYHVLHSLHIQNKHHQRASDGMSTSSELRRSAVGLHRRCITNIVCKYLRCFIAYFSLF